MLRKRSFLTIQSGFGKFIDVTGRNYAFKPCKWEMSNNTDICLKVTPEPILDSRIQ
jgi:hypothetical protein